MPEQSAREWGTAQDPKPQKLRAAEYLRMSTEHQKYSMQNQSDAIRVYANRHHMEIVQTYVDAGKSGLRIKGRDGLKRLIADVQEGATNFDIVLVYDISRWGRFQDVDESAHYEYLCRSNGVPVQYCAEQFDNDGSPLSEILKGIKRAMAGEYSRELSVKVFASQSHLCALGYRQGGAPGYGLRRMRINENGKPQGILKSGERKSLLTDRVILVPGAKKEIKIIKWIYQQFVVEGKMETEIAALLNHRGIETEYGRPWAGRNIFQILTSEKYIGNNIYNRRSYKLKKVLVYNSPSKWVRADGSFEVIVDPKMFYRARGIIRARNRRFSDKEMLRRLRQLFDQHGYLTCRLIDKSDLTPWTTSYQLRFGSLLRAYELVGFEPDRGKEHVELRRSLRQLHDDVVLDTIASIEKFGGSVSLDPETGLLTLNGEISVSIVVVPCRRNNTGSLRWKFWPDKELSPDITVVLRMDRANKFPLDYYYFPLSEVSAGSILLAEENGLTIDAYHFDSLEFLFAMAGRAESAKISI